MSIIYTHKCDYCEKTTDGNASNIPKGWFFIKKKNSASYDWDNICVMKSSGNPDITSAFVYMQKVWFCSPTCIGNYVRDQARSLD